MRAWFVIIILIQPLYSASIANCSLALQCANESTIANDTDQHNDGYKSHYGSLSTITGSQTAYCRGAFACAKASHISTNHCRCHGSNSCSKISNLEMSGILMGTGVNALAYTTIIAASKTVHCLGEQSCAYTQIEGASTVDGYGAYSLLNASIDSINGSGSSNINFYGYYAGFGATITCRVGHTCNIDCGSNGCVNLHLDCQNNCVINASLTDTTSSKNIADILLYDSFQFETENDVLCSAQNQTLKFDDYRERYKGEDIISDDVNDGPICCSAYESCLGINNIKSTKETIVCSGGASCEESNIYTNGTVFCGGFHSCLRSTITTIGPVYCYGSNSCESGDIIKASDVYCSAHQACHTTYISSNGSDLNIYFTSFLSGQDAHVLCHLGDACSLFCFGPNSCENLELECGGVCHVHYDNDTYCPIVSTPTPIEYVSTIQATTTTIVLMSTSAHSASTHSRNDPISTTQNTQSSYSSSAVYDTYGDTVTITSVDIIYNTKDKHSDKITLIIVYAVFSAILFVVMIMIVYLCYNKRKSPKPRLQDLELNAQVNMDSIPHEKGNENMDAGRERKAKMEATDTKTCTQTHNGDGHVDGENGIVNVVDHRPEGVKIKKDQNEPRNVVLETTNDGNKSIIYNMDPSGDTLVVGNDEETNFE